MKISNYNFFFPYSEEKQIAYNSLTSSLAFINNDSYIAYMALANENKKIEDEALEQNLLKGGYIHP